MIKNYVVLVVSIFTAACAVVSTEPPIVYHMETGEVSAEHPKFRMDSESCAQEAEEGRIYQEDGGFQTPSDMVGVFVGNNMMSFSMESEHSSNSMNALLQQVALCIEEKGWAFIRQ